MKIGLIGNGGHSKRIQQILIKNKKNFFIYKPDKPSYYDIEKYKKLTECDIIFVLSPNKTHYKYIKDFYKTKYIFCEKPPVNTLNELNKLKKLNYKKIYFNYNHRYSKLSQLLNLQKKFKLGKLIYANLISSYGLSLKKEYKTNWRSNKKLNPKGVYETVSIHWIDLINYHFKIAKICKPELLNLSQVGSSYDSSHIKLKLENNAIVNIYSTYNAPYSKRLFFLFENGIIDQLNNIIKINGPARNFDKKGFFIPPKLIKNFVIDDAKDYSLSLQKSVNFFLNKVSQKKSFSKSLFSCSIKTNELILK